MFALLLALSCTAAPPPDAPLTRRAPTQVWTAPGVTATVIPWERGGARGRLVVAEISRTTPLHVVPASQPAPLGDLLPAGDLIAVNGGFYDNGTPMGLVVSSSATVAPLTDVGGSGVFVIQGAQRRVVHRSDTVGLQGAEHAVQSIDRLVDQGAVLVSEAASPARDARTAVGVQADGDVLLAILFDEKAVESESGGTIRLNADSSTSGASLREWAVLMADLGAVSALNLDGGYSTSIEIRLGEAGLSVVPHRATINAVVARPR